MKVAITEILLAFPPELLKTLRRDNRIVTSVGAAVRVFKTYVLFGVLMPMF